MSLINRLFGEPEIRALDPKNKVEVKKMIDPEDLLISNATIGMPSKLAEG